MLLILLTYIYILFISLGYGIIFNKWIDLEKKNVLFTILIGFFSQLIFSTFYSLFLPLGFYFYILNTVISILIYTSSYSLIKKILNKAKNTFKSFSIETKLLFLFISIISVLHSSALPFITDNETYYIQTIKWLNNYGLVKGLVNLHVFLGQHSGWHILQSSFNFSFLAINSNDINGFLLIIVSFYSADKWENYKLFGLKNDLFIALLFISMVFLFLFIPSPSPDFPIIIITPIIINLFIESFQKTNNNNLILICILSLLLILIKVTIFPILLLPLFILIKTKNFKFWELIVLLAFISLSSFILKNIVISGYPFYPLSIGNEVLNVDWKINENVQIMSYRESKMIGLQMINWEDYLKLDFNNKFWIWLNLPRLNGVLNKLILLSLIVIPIILRKSKELKFLLAYFIIQYVILYLSSPQYRFFLPALLAIGLFIATELLHLRFIIIRFLMILNLTLLLYLGIFGGNFSSISNNKIMSSKQAFVPSQIIFPRANTQFENLEYEKHKIGNLEYFSPIKDSLFFWQTSDGPLPCVNKEMLDYFSLYYDHIPQMRTMNIKDGFKSVKP